MTVDSDKIDSPSSPPQPPPAPAPPPPALPAASTKIPRLLHVVWVGPHDPPDRCIESWRKAHPPERGWTFRLWTEIHGWTNQHVIDRMITHRREWNGVADLIRWEILSAVGGIVVDADSECVQPLDATDGRNRTVVDFFDHEAWSHYEHEALRPGVIGCGAMGAVRNAEVFCKCVEAVSMIDVAAGPAWKLVGPGLLTRVASELPQERLKVFPSRMFCPVHLSGQKAPGAHPIFARQHWAGSKGYGAIRDKPCRCYECSISMLRPPWG